MRRIVVAGVALGVTLGSAGAALADSVTLWGDQRTVTDLVYITDSTGTVSQTDSRTRLDSMTVSGAESTSLSSATASSSLVSSLADPYHLSGVGTNAISWSSPGGVNLNADSRYNVSFTVSQPMNYVFNGTFDTSGFGPRNSLGNGPYGFWEAYLTTYSNLMFSDSSNFSGAGSHAGVLAPGTYNLWVEAAARYGTGGQAGAGTAFNNMNFALDLTPTPEPATLLLLGGGLAMAAIRRRRSVQEG